MAAGDARRESLAPAGFAEPPALRPMQQHSSTVPEANHRCQPHSHGGAGAVR